MMTYDEAEKEFDRIMQPENKQIMRSDILHKSEFDFFVTEGNEFGWELFEGKMMTREQAEKAFDEKKADEDVMAVALCQVKDNKMTILMINAPE